MHKEAPRQVARRISRKRFARACTPFAVVALLFAALGLFGLMADIVARRTSAIGIRITHGAQRRDGLR